ncbi:MAG: camphor resistance protein CrcB [Acidimicrobiales bacterium]|nr:camphor resistance protein CrcB [Acidimicrobiales bacterium]
MNDSVRRMLMIGVGGAAGALLRSGALGLAGDDAAIRALLSINIIGSFWLGLAVVRLRRQPDFLAAVGTGFCGGFTSLSSFAVQVAELIGEGRATVGIGLAVVTALSTVAGIDLGIRISRETGE